MLHTVAFVTQPGSMARTSALIAHCVFSCMHSVLWTCPSGFDMHHSDCTNVHSVEAVEATQNSHFVSTGTSCQALYSWKSSAPATAAVYSQNMLCSSGSTVASSAELAGEEAPALFTIGRDGAVFFWMYEGPAPSTAPQGQSQGYPQVPGKHRKRKAPDSDPDQPAEVTPQVAAEADSAAGNDDSNSSSSSMDANKHADGVPGGSRQASDSAEEQGQASTSGRQHTEQQQTTSFAGKLPVSVSLPISR